jgi:hypothetical protein
MRSLISKESTLEVERDSLLTNLDRIGSVEELGGDFTERKIILLRYPVRKAPHM